MSRRLSERLVSLAVGDPEAVEGLTGDLREERARAGKTGQGPAYDLALIAVALRYAYDRWRRKWRNDGEERGRGCDGASGRGRGRSGPSGAGPSRPVFGGSSGDATAVVMLHEVRLALRSLGKAPGFTVLVVATLALGIGATTGMYSVVHGALFRQPPYPGYERMIMAPLQRDSTGVLDYYVSYLDYRDWEARADTLEALEGVHLGVAVLTGRERARRMFVRYVTPGFLELFGATATLGRLFGPRDERAPGSHPVIVVSHDLWRTELGADPDVIGTQVTLGGIPYTIVGVLGRGFRYPFGQDVGSSVDIWIPATMAGHSHPAGDDLFTDRGIGAFSLIGRLAPGVSLQEAQAELDGIVEALADEHPGTNRGYGVHVHTIDRILREPVRGPLLVLLVGAVVLLLVACLNVANLMTVRGTTRRREMALRLAIGARHRHLLRHVAAETLLLALAGGGLGVLTAYAGLPLLARLVEGSLAVTSTQLPPASEIALNTPVLLAALAASLGAALVFGIWPAFRATRADGRDALSAGGRHGPGRDVSRMRNALVVVEVATAMVLLASSVVLVRTMGEIRGTELGVTTERVVSLRVDPPRSRYPDKEALATLAEEIRARLDALPDVSWAVIWGPGRPGFSAAITRVVAAGAEAQRAREAPRTRLHVVSAGSLHKVGITLLQGRGFDPSDREDARPVAIVSRTLADRLWPDQDPVGRQLRFGEAIGDGAGDPGEPRTVVGVAADTNHAGRIPDPGRVATPDDLYLPAAQFPLARPGFTVRTAGEPRVEPLSRAVAELDPDIPVFGVSTAKQALAVEEGPTRFSMLLLTAFALAALLLAALGVYGVLAYAVSQRTREIGLRTALGAESGVTLRLFLLRGIRLALLGVALGSLGAFWMEGVLASLIVGVSGGDHLGLVAAGILLTVVAAVACWVPARWATRIDPIVALRE